MVHCHHAVHVGPSHVIVHCTRCLTCVSLRFCSCKNVYSLSGMIDGQSHIHLVQRNVMTEWYKLRGLFSSHDTCSSCYQVGRRSRTMTLWQLIKRANREGLYLHELDTGCKCVIQFTDQGQAKQTAATPWHKHNLDSLDMWPSTKIIVLQFWCTLAHQYPLLTS